MNRARRIALTATGLAALLGTVGSGFAQLGAADITPGSLPVPVAADTVDLPVSPLVTDAPAVTAPVTVPALPAVTEPAPVQAPLSTEPAPVQAPAPMEEAAPAAPAAETASPQPAAVEPPALAPAQADRQPAADSAPGAAFVGLTNNARASIGAASLRSDAALQAYAQRQAQAMADAGQIYHSNIADLLGPWSNVGENVGVGPSVTVIHDALVASPGHWANISNPAYTSIGVGVVTDTNGRVWTAHVFAA